MTDFSFFFESLFRRSILFLFIFFGHFFAISQTLISDPFDLEDRELLLIRLFDSDSISFNGEVLWKPLTFTDAISSNVSSDGFVHTALDTILYVEQNGINMAIALFETLPYEGAYVVDCNSCGAQISAALFDDAGEGRWEIVKFKKHFTIQGAFGMNGESGLQQFGRNVWCLRLQMSWMDEGIYGEYVSFYDLFDFEKIFNYTAHEDNQAGFEVKFDHGYSFDKSIHFIPNVETVSGWWDFDIVTQGTQPDNNADRVLPANEVTRYYFDWETSNYLKWCQ